MRFVTLGRLALLGGDAEGEASVAARRRKLALLAVLALARRPLSRDYLAEMFWGGQPQERARHSLSNALSGLRRLLGRDAIATHAAEVELALTEEQLEVDAVAFARAAAAGEDERALALYGGPFLDGVWVDGSASFEQWVAGERSRLEGLFLAACQRRCLALARARRWEECAELARRWLETATVSGDAALYRLNALRAGGSREGNQRALAEYERIRDLLQREYGLRPERAVTELARTIAAQVAAAGAEAGATGEYRAVTAAAASPPSASDGPRPPSSNLPPASAAATVSPPPASPTRVTPPPSSAPPSAPAPPTAHPRRGRLRLVLVGGGIAAALLLAARAAGILHLGWRPDGGGVPVIAIADVALLGGDGSSAWLADGLPQMVAAKLARTAEVEVVAPERVRQVRDRAELPPGAPVTPERAVELARRLGATWAVTGTVIDADTALQLDLAVRDARTGEPVRVITLRAPNVLALADAAAVRLLDAAGATRPGPQLAEIETPNVQAYEHFIRFLQLRLERPAEARRELDAALALDSGFVSALRERMNVALAADDRATMRRLDTLFQRVAYRATDWDRLSIAAFELHRAGDWPRALSAARALVERFPRDPRSHKWLTTVHMVRGEWDEAERSALAQLALDSLAISAGRGPCVPCDASLDLAHIRLVGRGDYAGAERVLRRLIELQPEQPLAWGTLAEALAAQGRTEEAIAASRRADRLADGAARHGRRIGEWLVMARRFPAVDSVARALDADSSRDARYESRLLRLLVARERGQLRRAMRLADSVALRGQPWQYFRLLHAEALAQTGDVAAARRLFEELGHPEPDRERFATPDLAESGAEAARTFTLRHAVQADALAAVEDTVRLRALADSVEAIGALTATDLDRALHHHLRGLVAMRGGRWVEAERHFQAVSRRRAWGWSRTLVEEARAQLAQRRAGDAVRTLRRAYGVPPNGLLRFVPRTELDLLMATAFRQAGLPDSAAVYAGHVRRAWRDADPEVKQRLSVMDEE